MSAATAAATACGSKPRSSSRRPSSALAKSRRARSAIAAARAASESAACSGSSALRLPGVARPSLDITAPPRCADRLEDAWTHSGRIGRLITVALLPDRQQPRPDLFLDLARHVLVLLEVESRVVLALADALALVAVPGARLLDDALLAAELDDLALAGDPAAVHDLEFGLAERGGDLVLHHLHPRHVPDDLLAVLDGAGAADVEADGGVELERVAARRRLGIAEHDADLHADLIDEDDDRVRAFDVAGQLAQRLRHEARVQAHLHLAHLPFDLRLRSERRDGVDHDEIDRARADQHVRDLERLLARVWLGDEKLADVHAQLLGIGRIERVLRIDERRRAAVALNLGHDLERESGLARSLRPEDFDDTPARQAPDAERDVEPERTGRDGLHVPRRGRIAEAHDGALAELLLDLSQCGGERLLAVVVHSQIPRGNASRCARVRCWCRCAQTRSISSRNYLTSRLATDSRKRGIRAIFQRRCGAAGGARCAAAIPRSPARQMSPRGGLHSAQDPTILYDDPSGRVRLSTSANSSKVHVTGGMRRSVGVRTPGGAPTSRRLRMSGDTCRT